MNEVAIETTLRLYEQLLIPAEESIKDMNNLFKKEKDTIAKIKEEINKTSDPNKQKELLKKCVNAIKSIMSELESIEESKFDIIKEEVISASLLSVSIASGLAVGIKTKSVLAGFGTSIGVIIAEVNGIMKICDIKNKKGTRKYSKKEIIDILKKEISWYERYIQALSNPKFASYIKDNNGSSVEKIESGFNKFGEDSVGKIIKTIIKYINDKVSKHAIRNYNMKVHWISHKDDNGNYTICPDKPSIDKIEDIYRNPSRGEERMLDDISIFFFNTINEINKRFNINQYGYTIREQPDEYCEFYIEKM